MDGWVSLEVSPLLAYDTQRTIAAAKDLYARAGRPNLLIKIPGTKEGLPAIEEAIFAGIPINVTLLFTREHYLAAAEAFMRGIERRLAAESQSQRRLRRIRVRQPVGRRGGRQGAGRAEEQARHRDCPAHVQGGRGLVELPALAARLQCRSAAAAPAVGEHGNERSAGLRCSLPEGARRPVHGEHDAREHA